MNALLISVQPNLEIIGIKQLHQVLLANGHASHLLYIPDVDPARAGTLDGLQAFVAQCAPGLIGISLMAADHPAAMAVTAHLKQAFPRIPIVWGGIHPTAVPESCLQHADYVCVGEGEQALVDMANAIDRGQPLTDIQNLVFLKDSQVCRNPVRPLIEDLDSLPVLEPFPPNTFVLASGTAAPLSKSHMRRYNRYGTQLHKVMTTRGCPYACTYCCNSYLRKLYPGWRVRWRSVAHVLRELDAIKQHFPEIQYVHFCDDCVLASPVDRLRDLCEAYKARIGVPFIVHSTPEHVTQEKMDLLVGAGLAWVNLGLQTGSPRVCADVYHRRSSPERFLEAARLVSSYPVATWYDIILDSPFERTEDTLDTARVLAETPRPFYPFFFSLHLYYGTELRERALEEYPDQVPAEFDKDFIIRKRLPINDLVEVTVFLPRFLARRLIRKFERAPKAWTTRAALLLAKLSCHMLLAPLTYFALIRRAQHGSWIKTLRVLPMYFRTGFRYYSLLFSAFKRRQRPAPRPPQAEAAPVQQGKP